MPEATRIAEPRKPFEEPPREEIPGISRGHVPVHGVVRRRGGRGASPACTTWSLHTIGRKSGNEHKVALPYWVDREGNRVVVASFSGAPDHPVVVPQPERPRRQPRGEDPGAEGVFWADAQVLDGGDYAETWAALNADRPWYDDYQSRTDRQIPLVRLVELRPA